MLASAFYSVLQHSGFISVARHTSSAGAILCYHNIVAHEPQVGAPGLHLDVDHFHAQVEWLSRHYTVIPLSEYARRLSRAQSLNRVIAITCDDGYQGVFSHAWPILRAFGLPVTVFVPTGLPPGDGFWWDAQAVVRCTTMDERDRWLTEFNGDGDRIGQLIPGLTAGLPEDYRLATWSRMAAAGREGCEFGVHTRTHRNLTRLSSQELHSELEGSRAALEERTGHPVTCFAYPYGLFDARVREAVRCAGFETAVTMDFGLNGIGADPLALRRINIPASIRPAAFQAWVSGIRPRTGASRS